MIKKSVIIILFLINTSLGFTLDPVVLNEIYNPNKIEIFNEKLYIAQETSFFIYSLKDLSFIKKFGRKGEGPGELVFSPFVFNDIINIDDKLFVQGEKKIIYFSENGEFINELKKNRKYFKISPFGKNFVIREMSDKINGQFLISIKLIDPAGNELKNIYVQKTLLKSTNNGNKQILPIITDTPQFTIYKNRLYVDTSDKRFKIDVYDEKCIKVGSILYKHTPIKISEYDKKKALEEIKNDKTIRAAVKKTGGWEIFKKRYSFIFPESFPVIKDFLIDQDKIYVQTYEKKNGKTVYIIMSIDGNYEKTIRLPNMEPVPFTAILVGQDVRLYKFYNNKFYYLRNNDEDETWKLYNISL